jgi:UDP-galactose transporter B1
MQFAEAEPSISPIDKPTQNDDDVDGDDNNNEDMKKGEHEPFLRTAIPMGIDSPTKQREPTAAVEAMRLIYGAGGIYAAFLYYGSLQEDVFNHVSKDGSSFKQAWFLQVLEALANVVVGFIGLQVTGGTPNIPQRQFMISGASQVSAKAFTSLALANGLSFPVATLAKSAKMAPVMAGQLILGGAVYTLREYAQVLAIIAGTAILSLCKKKGGASHSSSLGLLFILLSLTMDGVTGGVQKRLKANMSRIGVKPKPYDFMFYTNLYMMIVGLVVSVVLGDFFSGIAYCTLNPDIFSLIIKFSCCSAIGQSFIFYTVAHFDPLVCSTVTTTRKIFSVLLSIFLKGHHMTLQGWVGVTIAISGIISEVESKCTSRRKKQAGS